MSFEKWFVNAMDYFDKNDRMVVENGTIRSLHIGAGCDKEV
jgi:hypothetical protein